MYLDQLRTIQVLAFQSQQDLFKQFTVTGNQIRYEAYEKNLDTDHQERYTEKQWLHMASASWCEKIEPKKSEEKENPQAWEQETDVEENL